MTTRFITDSDGWETITRDVRHQDPYTELAIEHVRTPTRHEPHAWTVVHRKSAAVVAPITEEGRFVLIRQERIPLRAAIWEFPAGQIDEAGALDEALIRATALRELQEESGYELALRGELIAMGHFFSSPGFTDELAYLFVARGVRLSEEGHAHDHGESILECRAFSPRELNGMIASNEIRDANTLALFARMSARGIL